MASKHVEQCPGHNTRTRITNTTTATTTSTTSSTITITSAITSNITSTSTSIMNNILMAKQGHDHEQVTTYIALAIRPQVVRLWFM